jgi:hypothetical protein
VKPPSGGLVIWAVILFGGAAYVATALPSTAPHFQVVSGVLAACLLAVAVLLLVRFRWSSELFAALFLFLLGWGVVHGLAEGFTRSRVGLALE